MSPSLPLSPHISWKRRYRHWRQRDHRLTPPSPDYSSSAGVHTHTRACTPHRADCSYGRAQVALSVGHKLAPPCKQEHTHTNGVGEGGGEDHSAVPTQRSARRRDGKIKPTADPLLLSVDKRRSRHTSYQAGQLRATGVGEVHSLLTLISPFPPSHLVDAWCPVVAGLTPTRGSGHWRSMIRGLDPPPASATRLPHRYTLPRVQQVVRPAMFKHAG